MGLRLFLGAALLLIICFAGLFGGGGWSTDQALIIELSRWRSAHPDPASALIMLTHLGGAPVLLTLAALAVLATAWRDRPRAVALALTVLGGRLMIELMKAGVDRPRPSYDPHPVAVFSQSFPSGHAGNTMISFGAIALFALPGRWRVPGLAAAVALSLSIGATRPVLGVHWPSDVLGGWCFGALWLLACWSLWERFSRRA